MLAIYKSRLYKAELRTMPGELVDLTKEIDSETWLSESYRDDHSLPKEWNETPRCGCMYSCVRSDFGLWSLDVRGLTSRLSGRTPSFGNFGIVLVEKLNFFITKTSLIRFVVTTDNLIITRKSTSHGSRPSTRVTYPTRPRTNFIAVWNIKGIRLWRLRSCFVRVLLVFGIAWSWFESTCLNSSARNRESGQEVAIKKLINVFEKPILAKRALRELKLLKHFNGHENITSVFDMDLVDPQSFTEV